MNLITLLFEGKIDKYDCYPNISLVRITDSIVVVFANFGQSISNLMLLLVVVV